MGTASFVVQLQTLTHLTLTAKMDPAVQPNTTLYINNLNDKINKEELRTQLYALFATHGKVIDVVATKSPKMRGQAFLVFADLAGATTAMRACAGMTFYDKPLVRIVSQSVSYSRLIQPGSRSLFLHSPNLHVHWPDNLDLPALTLPGLLGLGPQRISYAKTKSHATLKREDPNFVPPSIAQGGALSEFNSKFASGVSLSEKRPRDDDGSAGREAKREKQQDSDEEMELEDDDDEPAPARKQ